MGPKGPINLNTAIAGTAIVLGTAVKRGADQSTVVQATANSQNLAIAYDNQDTIGRRVQIAGSGCSVLGRVGAAVALDALLASDANGKLITATTTQFAIARALEAATAVDQLIAIEVLPYGTKAP